MNSSENGDRLQEPFHCEPEDAADVQKLDLYYLRTVYSKV